MYIFHPNFLKERGETTLQLFVVCLFVWLCLTPLSTLYHIMLYTSPWSRFELTTSVVIGTDCIGNCKSNYHTVTETTAHIVLKNMLWKESSLQSDVNIVQYNQQNKQLSLTSNPCTQKDHDIWHCNSGSSLCKYMVYENKDIYIINMGRGWTW